MVQAAAKVQLGHPLKISATAVRDALDPMKNVARRNGVGDSAPASVAKMVTDARTRIAVEQVRLAERQRKIAAASTALDHAVAAMLGGWPIAASA